MQSVCAQTEKGCGTNWSPPFPRFCRTVMALVVFVLIFADAPGAEVRGLWVTRESITSAAAVRSVVDGAVKSGYTVLFVQVRGRGDAFYRSAFVPGPREYPGIPGQFDPLGALIPLAHARGMEVHAWFNTFLAWSGRTLPEGRGHIARAHPDWFAVSAGGLKMASCPAESVSNARIEGRFLSPGSAPAREYLRRVILEVVRTYPVDGVHLDYIRYPGWEYDFRESVREDFRKREGMDPRIAVSGENGADPTLALLGKWVEYRAELVGGFVREVSDSVRAVDPRIRVSAAVKPDPEAAYYDYGQDWPRWLRDGTVDFVAIMSYSPDGDGFRSFLRKAAAAAPPEKILGGVGVYRAAPMMAAEQIADTREAGLLGFCVFSWRDQQGNPGMDTVRAVISRGEKALPAGFRPYLRGRK